MVNATTVDVHAHALDRDAIEQMGAEFPGLAPTFAVREGQGYVDFPGGRTDAAAPAGSYDPLVRLADMDRQRVDLQVMAVPPYMFFYETEPEVGTRLARLQNDGLAAVAGAHPDRLHFMATLPLQAPAAAVAEIERMAAIPLLRGVEIGTNVASRNLDDPDLEPVWQALEDADLPVLVHSGRGDGSRMRGYHLTNLVGNPFESTLAIASLIFGGVLERHEKLRFCFVHGGGFAPYQIGRWDHGWACREEAQINIKQPPSTYFRNLYMDGLTHDQLSLSFLGERMGWDRVVLGTDYPFDMAESDPVGRVEQLGLPEADEALVMHENAARFLRPLPAS